jgi:hypothetical protein
MPPLRLLRQAGAARELLSCTTWGWPCPPAAASRTPWARGWTLRASWPRSPCTRPRCTCALLLRPLRCHPPHTSPAAALVHHSHSLLALRCLPAWLNDALCRALDERRCCCGRAGPWTRSCCNLLSATWLSLAGHHMHSAPARKQAACTITRPAQLPSPERRPHPHRASAQTQLCAAAHIHSLTRPHVHVMGRH